jgi:hypothetical protein
MKKIMRLVFGLAASTTLFVSCREVELKDGRIPKEYLNMARTYEGEYAGKFENRKGSFFLTLDGSRMRVKFVGADGSTDLLSPECQSKLGNIKSVSAEELSQNRYVLKSANVQFNPNRCSHEIEGRELLLTFRDTSLGRSMRVSLVEALDWRPECHGGGSSTPSRTPCGPQPEYHYMEGRFIRK